MQIRAAVHLAALCILVSSTLCIGVGVRVKELRVPAAVVLGEPVLLMCQYELGDEDLYVVKWYKDDLEFYRYEPKDLNQSIYFPQPGIDIDLQQSGSDAVYLRRVVLDSAGAYKCQVSTDAPTYSCVQVVKKMDVINIHLEGPTIVGAQVTYYPGEIAIMNCTSKSKPPVILNWFINGRLATRAETDDHGVDFDSLQEVSKSLRLLVSDDHFRSKGVLTVVCEASLQGRVVAMDKRELTRYSAEVFSSHSSAIHLSTLLIRLYLLWTTLR